MLTNKALAALSIFAVLTLSGCSIGNNTKPDGGVYKSTDGGKNFEQKSKIDEKTNISTASVLAMEVDPANPDTIYIGTRSHGILRSTDAGETWVKDVNNFTLVSSIIVDPTASGTIFMAAVKDGRGKIFKTTNGGEQWNEIFTEKTNGPRVLALALDRTNSNILYAGDTLGGIYKTEDAGQTWKTTLWAESSVRDIAMDSIDPQLIYFGTNNSGLIVSRDGGNSYTTVADSGLVYNVEAHPNRNGGVFMSNGDGLQVSFDAGTTWQVINTLVKPDELGSRGIAVDPKDDRVIYYASGLAFYKSVNGGETWSMVQFNVSRSIDLIKINPVNTETIYLGLQERKSSSALLPGL